MDSEIERKLKPWMDATEVDEIVSNHYRDLEKSLEKHLEECLTELTENTKFSAEGIRAFHERLRDDPKTTIHSVEETEKAVKINVTYADFVGGFPILMYKTSPEMIFKEENDHDII